MRKLFLLLGLLATVLCQAQTPAGIIKVIDGDTFDALCNGQKLRCRLANVDAPEKDQYFGKAAADSLMNWLVGKACELTILKKDLYGRNVVLVKYNGVAVDEALVAKGWAWHYEQYSQNKARLSVLQLVAKEKRLGLWQCDSNIPPYVWRGLNKRNKKIYEVCK